MAHDPPRSPFPFWRTVIDAHVITIENIGFLARIGWLWGVLVVAAALILNWALWPLERAAVAQGHFGSWTMLFVPALVTTLLGACIAVPWHRLLLKGEVVTPARLGGVFHEVMAYFNVVVIMIAALIAPLILLFGLTGDDGDMEGTDISGVVPDANAPDGTDGGEATGADETGADETGADKTGSDKTGTDGGETIPDWLSALLIVAGVTAMVLGPMAALGFVPTRLSLLLPAIATSNRRFTLAHSWRATRGFFWKLYLGSLVCLSMPLVMTFSWFSVVGPAEETSRVAFVREAVAMELIFFVAGMVVVTFLSMAYRKLAPAAETTTGD